jgi:hypothetical protein
MAQTTHQNHAHVHGPSCGHIAIRHHGHIDYLQEGHLHHQEQYHVDDHVIEVTDQNPERCTSAQRAIGHDREHQHGPGCGHEAVPHGDHVDYLVDGRLHHPHGDHCDDHGPVDVVAQ